MIDWLSDLNINFLEFIPLKEINFLWHEDYYNGPLNGVMEYNNIKYWYYIYDSNNYVCIKLNEEEFEFLKKYQDKLTEINNKYINVKYNIHSLEWMEYEKEFNNLKKEIQTLHRIDEYRYKFEVLDRVCAYFSLSTNSEQK